MVYNTNLAAFPGSYMFRDLQQGSIGSCEAYEFNQDQQNDLLECVEADFTALGALVNGIADAEVRAEVTDILLSPLEGESDALISLEPEDFAGKFRRIKALTTPNFFCDPDFIAGFPSLFTCRFTVCDATCDNIPEVLKTLNTNAYQDTLDELASCNPSADTFCDLLEVGVSVSAEDTN